METKGNQMIIAVDPGSSSGAIATYAHQKIAVYNMPSTPTDLFDFLDAIASNSNELIQGVAENVGGAMPGNAAKSARTFAIHQGHLEMALIATGISTIKVTPRKWMDAVAKGRPLGVEKKTARKNYIYDQMQRRWPGVKFTKKQADAVGILTWYLDTHDGVV